MKNLYFSLLPDAEKAKCKTEKQWFKLGFVPVSQDAGTIMYSNRFCTGKYRYLTSEEVRKATNEEMTPYHEEQRRKRRSRYLQSKKEREQAIRYGELLSLCDQQRQLDEENYRGTIPTLTVSIDIETTGLDFNQDEILQVSILDIDTGEVLLDSYVKPYFTEDWPEARRVNHITKEMVCNAPYIYELLPRLNQVLAQVKTIVGYNFTGFDKEQDAKQRAVHYATAERYAKVIASAIIGNTGSVNSGDSSEYFNETARGLITGLVLLVSQYGQDGERHIVSVFNLIVELAGADNPEKGNTVQKSRLAAMLEGVTDRRIKGYISTTTSADIRTTLNIVSSALSKLLKFVDAELEQLICTHDNDLDAERFIERPTAIFLIAPDENETRHFLASLFVRFLTDDLIALAERQGGHCPRPFYYFLDEFGNFPAIPGVTSLFSAIRSRGGRILVAVQSYSQFLLKYDKNVTEIIKDNCQILLNTFVSPSAQDTATSISKMLGDETILTGSSSRSDGKTTSSHQLMGRPLMSPAQMVRIQRDTWIVEKAGYAPMKTHLEGYWKYLSLAPQEQDSTGENDYLEIKLLSTESLRQALGSAPARPHAPSAATREPRRKLGASRREAAALYPGKFNP